MNLVKDKEMRLTSDVSELHSRPSNRRFLSFVHVHDLDHQLRNHLVESHDDLDALKDYPSFEREVRVPLPLPNAGNNV